MVICLERGVNDLHMAPHRLLLH